MRPMQSGKTNILLVSGFGEDELPKLQENLYKTGKFGEIKFVAGCHWLHALRDPENRIDAVEDALNELQFPKLIIGHSYGALLSLAAACRKDIGKISGIFINGPLNPDILVAPPEGKWGFVAFMRHYAMREQVARACTEVLAVNPKAAQRFTTFVSPDDAIVPPAAQQLPGITSYELPGGHHLSSQKIAAITQFISL